MYLLHMIKCFLFSETVTPIYGDIIQFYNEIYMQKMTPYALKFSGKQSMVGRQHTRFEECIYVVLY